MTDIDTSVYKVAFQKTNNPAIITDPDFTIRDVNPAFLEFTGYDRNEIIGKTPNVVFHQQDIYLNMADNLLNGDRWDGSFEATTKAGRTVYGRGSAFPVNDANGDPQAYAGFFTDLTERKQYEDTLKILNRVLRHNLKNDANVILGYITTVRDELDDDRTDLKRFLSKSESKIHSLLNHSDTARNLQSLLSEDTKGNVRPVRIDKIVERQVRSAQSDFSNADFSFDTQPDKYVYGVADDSIHEVLDALFENAVQHNTNDNPTVNVSVETDDHFVTISVTDNGPGIPDDRKNIIFGREEHDQLHHGQGFSLFFVDNVVEKYNGNIWVENNDNKPGATFYLKLPRPADTTELDTNSNN